MDFATVRRSLPNLIKFENRPYFEFFCYPRPWKISSEFNFCDKSANMAEMRQNVKMNNKLWILRHYEGHCQVLSNLKICHILEIFVTSDLEKFHQNLSFATSRWTWPKCNKMWKWSISRGYCDITTVIAKFYQIWKFAIFCYPGPRKKSSKFHFCDKSANMAEMRQNVKIIN